MTNNEILYYEVQTWTGKTLFTCDTLSDADDFKLSLFDKNNLSEEELDSALEDIYIIGFDENGNEIAPQW